MVATGEATADGAVWFAKNSDREPGEAQVVELIPARLNPTPSSLPCTYIEIPQVERTFEVLISRPFWMWGAEMGVNEKGVAIGNEAVFTKLPYRKTGLTGMDLLRLALERSPTASEALDTITRLIEEYGQGGGCGYRHRRFRYHNSFIIADRQEAWTLETAGSCWAAQRVKDLRTISNALSIQTPDLVSANAGSLMDGKAGFRSAFSDPRYSFLAGGANRMLRTTQILSANRGQLRLNHFFDALRDHAGKSPSAGWKMKMPCAHASWWPARRQGQTTGSMVCRLGWDGVTAWVTGTSSPCLSVFKPVLLGGGIIDTGPQPGEGYDEESLYWRHEELHRLALRNYDESRRLLEDGRRQMEERFTDSAPSSNVACQRMWEEHREIIPQWAERLKAVSSKKNEPLFHRFWAKESEADRLPVDRRRR